MSLLSLLQSREKRPSLSCLSLKLKSGKVIEYKVSSGRFIKVPDGNYIDLPKKLKCNKQCESQYIEHYELNRLHRTALPKDHYKMKTPSSECGWMSRSKTYMLTGWSPQLHISAASPCLCLSVPDALMPPPPVLQQSIMLLMQLSQTRTMFLLSYLIFCRFLACLFKGLVHIEEELYTSMDVLSIFTTMEFHWMSFILDLYFANCASRTGNILFLE